VLWPLASAPLDFDAEISVWASQEGLAAVALAAAQHGPPKLTDTESPAVGASDESRLGGTTIGVRMVGTQPDGASSFQAVTTACAAPASPKPSPGIVAWAVAATGADVTWTGKTLVVGAATIITLDGSTLAGTGGVAERVVVLRGECGGVMR